MTPTIKTLTAVAALTLAAGGAMAQDKQTVPLAQPGAEVTAPETGTTFVVKPDGSKETLKAEAPAEAATPAETPAETPAATEAAPAEAAATEAAPEAATAEAPAEEPAAEAEPAEAEAPEAAPAEEETAEAPAEEAPAEEASAEAPAETEAEAPAEAEAEAPAEEAAAEAPAEAEAEAPAEEPAEAAATDEAAEGGEEEAAAAEEAPAEAPAASHEQEITDVAFSFEGPFGSYDQHQLQRGLQVYTEICAACHGLRYVPIRTLGDATGPGLPEDQVRAYAAELTKVDPDTGEDVPREPSDNFPYIPHADGMGPDLSLMAKARAGFHGPYGTGISQLFNGIGGPEYIYSILTHYTGETKEEAGTTLYENTAFPGGWIAMPPPLDDDSVTFEDGHPTDLHSIATEISAFLMWTAEPKMMQRKEVGTVAVLFLILLTVLLYLTNKKLWTPVKHPRRDS